jgi:hypothetical protein
LSTIDQRHAATGAKLANLKPAIRYDACATLQLSRYFSTAQSETTANVESGWGCAHDTLAVASLLLAEESPPGFGDSRRLDILYHSASSNLGSCQAVFLP